MWRGRAQDSAAARCGRARRTRDRRRGRRCRRRRCPRNRPGCGCGAPPPRSSPRRSSAPVLVGKIVVGERSIVEQADLRGGVARRREAQMLPGDPGQQAAARRALPATPAGGGRARPLPPAYRAARTAPRPACRHRPGRRRSLGDCTGVAPVQAVQAEVVDLELGGAPRSATAASTLALPATVAKSRTRRSSRPARRRAPRPPGDLDRAVRG